MVRASTTRTTVPTAIMQTTAHVARRLSRVPGRVRIAVMVRARSTSEVREATSRLQQSSVSAVPHLTAEQSEEPGRRRPVLERNAGPGCFGQEGPVLLPSRVWTQVMPGLGEFGPFEMTNPRSPDRFFEHGLAEYLYRPPTPTPKTVLRVPARMKWEPATGKDHVERILVGPDQAFTAIS